MYRNQIFVPRKNTRIGVSFAVAYDHHSTHTEYCRDVSSRDWHVATVPFTDLEQRSVHNELDVYLSPITWQHNRRDKDDFASCSFLAIDFDSPHVTFGGKLSAIKYRHDLLSIVATSRHHQKPKVKGGGKVEPACDRFHLFIALDRVITDSAEYDDFYAGILCHPFFKHADPQCMDRVRIFGAGGPDSIVRLHEGQHAISVDAVLDGYRSGLLDKKQPAKPQPRRGLAPISVNLGTGVEKADGNVIRWMWDHYEKTPWREEQTTRARIFGTICYALADLQCVPGSIAASVREWGVYRDWLGRHPEKEGELADTIKRALERVAEEQKLPLPLVPRNPVVEFDQTVDLPPDLRASTLKLRESRGMSGETSRVDELLYHCMTDPDVQRAIINTPCGSGKTTSAVAYAACRANTEHPIWIVTDTRKALKCSRDELRDVFGEQPGYLTGFDLDECPVFESLPVPHERYMYSRKTTPCHECSPEHQQQCAFHGTVFSVAKRGQTLRRPIVLVTHRRFVSLISNRQIPAEASIIVDEELKRWQKFIVASHELTLLKDVLRPYLRADNLDGMNEIEMWREFVDGLDAVMKEAQDSRRGIRADLVLEPVFAGYLVKRLHNAEDADIRDGTIHERLTLYSWAHEFVRYFGHPSPKCLFYTSGDWTFSADTISMDLPNRIIFLNASAMYSPVEWEGATIYRLVNRHSYPHLHLHTDDGNPTRKSKADNLDSFRSRCDAFLQAHRDSRVFMAVDKKPDAEVLAWIEDLKRRGFDVRIGYRGTILGSNDYREANVVIFAMANFTSVSDYVLNTMHVTDHEIDRDRVWTAKGQVRMHSGFDDPAINREFSRLCVDEVYQTIMRANIRSTPNAECHIFLRLNPEILLQLGPLFSDATFISSKATEVMLTMAKMDTATLGKLSMGEINKMLGVQNRKTSHKAKWLRIRNALTIQGLTQGVPPTNTNRFLEGGTPFITSCSGGG
jgi:hypothetical protein